MEYLTDRERQHAANQDRLDDQHLDRGRLLFLGNANGSPQPLASPELARDTSRDTN